MHSRESYPLPEDPALAQVAAVLRDAEHWAWIFDHRWRLVYMTDALRVSFGNDGAPVPTAIGCYAFGPEALEVSGGWRFGPNTPARMSTILRGVGGWLLADARGGVEELQSLVDPSLHEFLDGLTPSSDEMIGFVVHSFGISEEADIRFIGWRVRQADGRLAGTVLINKPAVSMTMLGAIATGGDLRHFELMQRVSKAARRPAAILFADLEGSSPLARRLSTASYFALGRRLVRAADRCVIDAGGLVGRHVGDGVVAFFLAETTGSESAAARACISAARALRGALGEVATRSGLEPDDIVLRFGLHWGSTLYVGAVTTSGRAEVTALGDEVNEAARIEACATGGLTLASKALVERLEPDDAAVLDLDPDRVTYTPLADLSTATEKARRDAPAVAVCEV
jgi:class 3 adenylate cyclase